MADTLAGKARDQELGLYRKYEVVRLSDPEGKHEDCEYYVLDWEHDKFALPAMEAYAMACEEEFPRLAEDIRKKLTERGYYADDQG
jgi:hypothetical protein